MLRAGGTTPELAVLGAATCVLHLGDYLGDLRPQGPIGELGPSQLSPAGRKGVRVGVSQSTGLLPFFAEVWPITGGLSVVPVWHLALLQAKKIYIS